MHAQQVPDHPDGTTLEAPADMTTEEDQHIKTTAVDNDTQAKKGTMPSVYKDAAHRTARVHSPPLNLVDSNIARKQGKKAV